MSCYELSVVLPCRNEELYIENCIASIHRAICFAGLDEKAEIIVVDGKSTDKTLAMLSRLTAQYPNLKTITNNMVTTPHAFNLGIHASRGRIIAILGVHWKIEDNYFQKTMNTLSSSDTDIVGGALIAKGGEGWASRTIARAMQNPVGTGRGMRSAPGEAPARLLPADTVPGGVFRREVYDIVGPFNPALIRNQDDEWMARARNAGLQILQDTSIKTFYHCRNSLKALAKQYYQYGYYKVYTLLPGFHFGLRQALSCGLILYLLTAGVMLLGPWTRKFGVVALASYPGIIFLQTAWTIRLNRDPLHGLSSIIATIVMQIAYGIGIWAGILGWKRHPVNTSTK